jgi:hypothetical protein
VQRKKKKIDLKNLCGLKRKKKKQCSDLLKVNYSTEIKVVSMYSIIGNCVYSQLVNNNQTTIDTHLLPTGIYTLKCETTNAVITKKIIVQQ